MVATAGEGGVPRHVALAVDPGLTDLDVAEQLGRTAPLDDVLHDLGSAPCQGDGGGRGERGPHASGGRVDAAIGGSRLNEPAPFRQDGSAVQVARPVASAPEAGPDAAQTNPGCV